MQARGMLVGVALLTANVAHAESNADFIGSVAFGYTTLDFEAKLDSVPSFKTIVVSGGMLFDNYNITLSYADSVGNTSISEEEDMGDGRRTDFDLTLGYRVNDALNLFLGYKDSVTAIDFVLRDDGAVRRESYKKDGWFAGLSYNIALESAGTVTLNLGYVDLSTDNLFLADDDGGDVEDFDDLTGRNKGSADGWSYGISWLVPVNKNLFINTTYKINDYEEDIDFEGATYSTDQELTFFTVGIIYLF